MYSFNRIINIIQKIRKMTKHASYIYSSYSFIHSLPIENVLRVGSLDVDGIPIPSFDEDLLINLCDDAKNILANEENIININGNIIVVGDIHGSFHDLLRILCYLDKSESKVLFLGDYVDRGSFSIECITILFTLKVLFPDKYFLLRGNHEFDDLCSLYGFKREILDYYDPKKEETSIKNQPIFKNPNDIDFDLIEEDDQNQLKTSESNDQFFTNYVNISCYKYSEKLYQSFVDAFSYLPICSIINQNTMCIHGGLTPLLTNVDCINTQITRPICDFEENLLLSDIVWSDPSPNMQSNYGESQRGRGKVFNGPAVVNFLKFNHLKRIIRGHQCVKNGIEKLFNDKLITVFSASSYSKTNGNSSGILKIYEKTDEIQPVIFPPLPRLKKFDANYFRVQLFNHQTKKKIFNFFSFGAVPSSLNGQKQMNLSLRQSKFYFSSLMLRKRKSKMTINSLPMLKSGPTKKNLSLEQTEAFENNG